MVPACSQSCFLFFAFYLNMNLLHFNNLQASQGLVHFQTTREGGCSLPPFDTTNMSYSVGDNPYNVLRNREALAAQIGETAGRFVFIKQVHGTRIAVVTDRECGRGVWPWLDDKIEGTDGLITNTPHVVISVKTADCIPVLLFDPVQRVIAAIHAGWRGTAARILPHAVEIMQSRFGSRPADLLAGIGAGAGACCYEVSEEVYNAIRSSLQDSPYPTCAENNRHIDLKEINRMQLVECGVQAAHIEVSPLCSICNPRVIFSHRASGGVAGRSLTGICLKW